ncbi:hypothetical protein H4Q26_010662 [Puccinia striiformis f. sp. tritici PST-130]|nr:hypothetical protein H4Q26_010662 [Puccinia striiformis f. sp. tritici PST-130]
MSNAHLYNYEDKYHFTASKNVTDMFANNKQIQELFGLHQAPLIQYPALGIAKVPENKQQAVPQHIRDKLQNKVRQVYSNKISQHDLVQSGTFVLVNSTSYGKYVASVNSIWQAIPLDQMKIFLEVTPFHRLEIDRFYQMREYQKTDKSIAVRKKVCADWEEATREGMDHWKNVSRNNAQSKGKDKAPALNPKGKGSSKDENNNLLCSKVNYFRLRL